MNSRNSPTVIPRSRSNAVESCDSRMSRDTSSFSGGTTGLFRSAIKGKSASTRLAATRSLSEAAAIPASWSPDFSSLAFAINWERFENWNCRFIADAASVANSRSMNLKSQALLREDQRRAADAIDNQIDAHLNSIRDPDKRNAAIHSEFLSVKRHRPFDFPVTARFVAFAGERQRFRLRHHANRECSRHVKGVRAGPHDLRRAKGDVRVLPGIKKILVLQLVILHPASRIHARRLNLDIQNAVDGMVRRELQCRIPFIERTFNRH